MKTAKTLALVGLISTLLAMQACEFPFVFEQIQKFQNPFIGYFKQILEISALVLGFIGYSGLLLGKKRNYGKRNFRSLFIVLLITRLFSLTLSRGFPIPFAGVFSISLNQLDNITPYQLSDYWTSNFELPSLLLICLILLSSGEDIEVRNQLRQLGKQEIIPGIKKIWVCVENLEASYDTQYLVFAKNEVVLLHSSNSKDSKSLESYPISSINKLEISKITKEVEENEFVQGFIYLEIVFKINKKNKITRYIYLDPAEGVSDLNYKSKLSELVEFFGVELIEEKNPKQLKTIKIKSSKPQGNSKQPIILEVDSKTRRYLASIDQTKILSNLRHVWETSFDGQKKGLLFVTDKEILDLPVSWIDRSSKQFELFTADKIHKIELSKTTLVYANGHENFVELTISLKDKKLFRRLIFLGNTEREVNSRYPQIYEALAKFAKGLKIIEGKPRFEKQITRGGGFMMTETTDFDSGY